MQLRRDAQLTPWTLALLGEGASTWRHVLPSHRSDRTSDDERLLFGYSPKAKHHEAEEQETVISVDGLGDGA